MVDILGTKQEYVYGSVQTLLDEAPDIKGETIVDAIFQKNPITKTIVNAQIKGIFSSRVGQLFERLTDNPVGTAQAESLSVAHAKIDDWYRLNVLGDFDADVTVLDVLVGDSGNQFAMQTLLNNYNYNPLSERIDYPTAPELTLLIDSTVQNATVLAQMFKAETDNALPKSVTTRTPIEDAYGVGIEIVEKKVIHETQLTHSYTAPHTSVLTDFKSNQANATASIEQTAEITVNYSVTGYHQTQTNTWREYTDDTSSPVLREISELVYINEDRELTFTETVPSTFSFTTGFVPGNYVGIVALVNNRIEFYLKSVSELPENAPIEQINHDQDGFYPFVPLRIATESVLKRDVSDELLQGVRSIERHLGVDFDSIEEEIVNAEQDDPIEYVALGFGVPLYKDDELSLLYQAKFIEMIMERGSTVYGEWGAPRLLTDEFGQPIKDEFTNDFIWVIDGAHDVQVVDPVDYELRADQSLSIRHHGISLNFTIHRWSEQASISYREGSLIQRITRSVSGGFITYEIQEKENLIKVINIRDFFYNWGIAGYVAKKVGQIKGIEAIANEDQQFFLPLYQPILEQFTVAEQQLLCDVSPSLITVSYDVLKVKWYEGTTVNIALKMVAAYFTITTLNDFWIGLTEALTVSLTNAIVFVLKEIAIQYLTAEVFKELVDLIGLEAALVLIALYSFNELSKLQSGSGLVDNYWADKLLELSAGFKTGVTAYLDDAIMEINSEMQQTQEEAERLLEELEQKRKLVEGPLDLNPFSFTQTEQLVNFNESPEQYYFRTIHSGNVGTLAYDAIEYYVDQQLQLPKPTFS
jgi:transcriptional regulator with XRE-family HTH domain